MNFVTSKIYPLLLVVGMGILPTIAFSAGGDTTASSYGAVGKETTDYSKSTSQTFDVVQKYIKEERYLDAYLELESLPVTLRDEADRQNLLGFTARKSSQLKKAAKHYEKALAIDPNHKGALEYQGELFLTLDQLEKAYKNLERLKEVCPLGCEEYTKLEAAIEAN